MPVGRGDSFLLFIEESCLLMLFRQKNKLVQASLMCRFLVSQTGLFYSYLFVYLKWRINGLHLYRGFEQAYNHRFARDL